MLELGNRACKEKKDKKEKKDRKAQFFVLDFVASIFLEFLHCLTVEFANSKLLTSTCLLHPVP